MMIHNDHYDNTYNDFTLLLIMTILVTYNMGDRTYNDIIYNGFYL
jgi:hypothetical protein